MLETRREQHIAKTESNELLSLLQNRKFLLLWFSGVFSSLALSVYLLAEAWYVVRALGLEAALGIVMMATTLPRVFLMVVGGVMADRFRRSRVMSLSDFTRGGLMAVMMLVLLYDGLTIWVLTGFALCFGILDAFFWPASRALLPSVVEKAQITRANSFIQTSNYFALLIGPVIAGFTIKYGSFTGVFATTGVLLMIAGVLAILIKEAKNASPDVRHSPLQDIREGIEYVRSLPILVMMMGASVVINFFLTGPVNIGLPLLVDQSLSGDVLELSFLESSLAVGTIAGAVVTAIFNFKKRRPVISLALTMLLGLCCALLSQMTVLWFGIVVITIIGICLAIGNIIMPSLVQEITEPSKMGRVQSLMGTASMGLIPLSYAAVSSLLSLGVSITWIMLISSCILVLFTAVLLWKVKAVWTID